MRIPVAAALLLLGLSAVPNAAADIEVALPDASSLDASAADIALAPCQAYVQDRDGDGEAETWNNCGTPPCGCACPVVGAGVVVEAADEEHGAWVATSGCQTAFGTMSDDADGNRLPVKPFVWTWGPPEISTS